MNDGMGINSGAPRMPAQSITSSAQSAPKQVVTESTVKSVEATSKAAPLIDSKEQARVSAQQLQSSVDQLNRLMKEGQRNLAFSVDESAGEVVIRVSDRNTNELVRQIPTEEALAIREHLDRVMGMLFSEKV